MHVAEISFRFAAAPDDSASFMVEAFLNALRLNGQILGREQPLVNQEIHTWATYVMVPAPDSLDETHHNRWVRCYETSLRELGMTEVVARVLGPSPDAADLCTCKERRSFILYTTYACLESCLRCGDCFDPVPLYEIPSIGGEAYDPVLFWASDYQACDSLQMGCATGERFGLREIGVFDSSLSRRGQALCRTIEAAAGLPAFYYLHRYRGRSLATERARRCPGCGGKWLLEAPLHDQFDFCCRECRLLSNIALTVKN